jgi:hypothetical protein
LPTEGISGIKWRAIALAIAVSLLVIASAGVRIYLKRSNTGEIDSVAVLPRLDQLRSVFWFFAVFFGVNSSVFIVALLKSDGVETKYLPFDGGLLAICRQHVSAQQ